MSRHHTCAQALFEALKPDPFYASLEATHKDPAKAQDAMLAYYDASIADGAEWGRISVADDGYSGVSVWSVPLEGKASDARRQQKQQRLMAALGSDGLKLFNEIEASMDARESDLDLEGHWYLSILGVMPTQQGTGYGAKLVRAVLEEADALGVSSYLTTFTPRNIPFYEKLGYETAATFPEPVTQSAFSVLIRTPE